MFAVFLRIISLYNKNIFADKTIAEPIICITVIFSFKNNFAKTMLKTGAKSKKTFALTAEIKSIPFKNNIFAAPSAKNPENIIPKARKMLICLNKKISFVIIIVIKNNKVFTIKTFLR